MKIRPVGAALFHADGRAGMTKLGVTYRYFSERARWFVLLCKYLLFRPLYHENPRIAVSKFSNAKSTFRSLQCVYILEALVGKSPVLRII